MEESFAVNFATVNPQEGPVEQFFSGAGAGRASKNRGRNTFPRRRRSFRVSFLEERANEEHYRAPRNPPETTPSWSSVRA